MFKKNKKNLFQFLGGLSFLLLSIAGVIQILNKNGVGGRNTKIVELKNSCRQCNILLVDIDILRADELPCYGYFRNTTPGICAFAKNSWIFTDNYATSYWTLPSIFSTATSLYPAFHKVNTGYIDKLSPDISTMAELLHKNGYKTVFIGWKSNQSALSQENNGLRGYDIITLDPLEKVLSDLSKEPGPWFVHYYNADIHLPYVLSDKTRPLENMEAPKNLPITQNDFDKLLNIYLKKHYQEVFRKETINTYKDIILSAGKPNDTDTTNLFYSLRDGINQPKYLLNSWMPVYNTYMNSFDKNKDSDVAYVRMMYDTKLNLVDKSLSKALQTADTELADKTITVIMSDHGEAFGEHGNFNHESSDHYKEIFHTPLIVRVPKSEPDVVEGTTSNIDIFPTLIDLLGIQKPKNATFQGKTLLPVVYKNNTPETFAVGESGDGVLLQNKNWLYFLPDWSQTGKQAELYDRVNDSSERNNVAEQNPELIERLFKQADFFRSYRLNKQKQETLPGSSGIKLDPEKIKRMQKEGYF